MFNSDNFSEQLRLFMPASELKDDLTTSFDLETVLDNSGERYETMDEMWDRKLDESRMNPKLGTRASGLYEGIKSAGYDWDEQNKNKITIMLGSDSKRLEDGHHRVAAASALEKETGKDIFIPIDYSQDYLSKAWENDGDHINDIPGRPIDPYESHELLSKMSSYLNSSYRKS
jgi:hypothetical protein